MAQLEKSYFPAPRPTKIHHKFILWVVRSSFERKNIEGRQRKNVQRYKISQAFFRKNTPIFFDQNLIRLSPLRLTPSVSRVLSRTVINLRRLSPIGFGQNARATRGAYAEQAAPLGVASDRVYSKCMLPCKWVSSYLAFPSLPSKTAVYFCCTFPTVTCGWRYQLPCSMKLGLSSR